MLPDARVRQRDYLLEISRAMTGQLDLREVLLRILEAAVSMLSAQVGLIALYDETAHALRAHATFGVPVEALPLFAPLLDGILDEAQTGLNMEVLNIRTRQVARTLDVRLRQALALPMIMHGSIVGVIFVFRAYQIETTANDRQVLQSFADQAAIAVQNARLYEHVRDEQQRLAAILEHSADGVLILDARHVIRRFNRALARMSGWSAESAIGQLHETVIALKRIEHGESLEAAIRHGWPHLPTSASAVPGGAMADRIDLGGSGANESGFEGILDDDAPDTLYVEGDLLRPDGSFLSVGITYAPLTDEAGVLKNVIVTVRDITHFREAQALKSIFISIVSHELKTPVALIKGYADTLRRVDTQWDEATMQQGLAVIEDEADRLTALIENLLAASKLQAEGMRLTQINDVNLPQIAARSVERFQIQVQVQKNDHHLRVAFSADFPIIQGDETRLRQVLDNLIGNAIKYSPSGGEIAVEGAFDDESVRVSVSDQGIGLSAEEQARLFERFYRVDSTLSRKTQGTGLGLYLARAIVEAHGGTIRVESEPGHGSTFTFTIPRQQPPP
jgi:signal transduction histidine kinase/GAF domain-containing protein